MLSKFSAYAVSVLLVIISFAAFFNIYEDKFGTFSDVTDINTQGQKNQEQVVGVFEPREVGKSQEDSEVEEAGEPEEAFEGGSVGSNQRCSSSSECTNGFYCGWVRAGGYRGCIQQIPDYQTCNPNDDNPCQYKNLNINGRSQSIPGVCRFVQGNEQFILGARASSSGGYYCLPPLLSYPSPTYPSVQTSVSCNHDDQCDRGVCNLSPLVVGDYPKICMESNIPDGGACLGHNQCRSTSCLRSASGPGVCETSNAASVLTVTLTAGSGAGTYPNSPSATTGNRITVNSNQPVSITRTVRGVNGGCTVRSNPTNSAWTNLQISEGYGTGTIWFNTPGFPGRITVPTTFELSCTRIFSNGQSTIISAIPVTIDIVDPPTITLRANPSSVNSGQTAALDWIISSTARVESCQATGVMSSLKGQNWNNIDFTRELEGSFHFSPTVNTNFGLTCRNAGGSSSAQAVVNINQVTPPQITSFTASSTSVRSGSLVTLSWSSTNADSCTGSGGLTTSWDSSKPTSGTANVFPNRNTVYTLTCSNSAGRISRSVTVNVVAPPNMNSFTANRLTVNRDATDDTNRVVFTWNIPDATSCVGSGPLGVNAVTTGGSNWYNTMGNINTGVAFRPLATSTYTLTCSNSAGSSSKSIPITVNSLTNLPLTFTSNVASINRGGSVTLRWNSPGATYCTSSQGISGERSGSNRWGGNVLASSEFLTRPTTTTTYALQCLGNNARSITKYVTIQVNQPLSINSLTFSKQSPSYWTHQVYGNINFLTTNAASCTLVGGPYSAASPLNVGIGGGIYVNVAPYTSFTLTCRGYSGNTVFRSLTVY